MIVDSILSKKPPEHSIMPYATISSPWMVAALAGAMFRSHAAQAAVSSAQSYLSIQVSLRGY